MARVLITGGARGIGLAACTKFLAEGFSVVSISRDGASHPLKDSIEAYSFDLTEVHKIPELVAKIGEVDVLVNNAGIIHNQSYGDYEYSDENKKNILAVNLEAPVALMQECSKAMREKNAGRIVNVTSVAACTGHPDIWYGITKAGLINATKSFARQLGNHGIVVTSVAPGPVHTDMLATIDPKRIAGLKENSVSGEFATPEQIAEIIYWLSTSAPNQVNGQSIDANNGAYMR